MKEVLFIYHMHQPIYRSPEGEVILPWTRLHSTKDYYGMAKLLEETKVKAVFNFSPSLIYQIIEYSQGKVNDLFEEISFKPARDLTLKERKLLLRFSGYINRATMGKSFPRYLYLLEKRGQEEEIEKNLGEFSVQELRDLQLLWQLSWTDPDLVKKEPLKELVEKERLYTEEDKETLHSAQREIIKSIIPLYKRLWEKGKIEIWISPFYHPILPLLVDSTVAWESSPLKGPRISFRYPQDAEWHVKRGIELVEMNFGRRPKGCWPSEGSVSEEALRILVQHFSYIATDDDILRRSEDNPSEPYYYSYRNIGIFFRNSWLSNKVGFDYKHTGEERAGEQFLKDLSSINSPLVIIALDGENPWEHYPEGGRTFLRKIYSGLTEKEGFRTVTAEEASDLYTPKPLRKIHPGSWVSSNFDTWMASEKNRKAWSLLKMVRDKIEFHNGEKEYEDALKMVYIGESSDWFWWYSDFHYCQTAFEFDKLFRGYLISALKYLKEEIPKELYHPIAEGKGKAYSLIHQVGDISPEINGKIDSFFEWMNAGEVLLKVRGESMDRGWAITRRIFYGFVGNDLFLRIDTSKEAKDVFAEGYILRIDLGFGSFLVRGEMKEERMEVGIDEILEARFKLPERTETLEIYMIWESDHTAFERIPFWGKIKIDKFKERDWSGL